MSPDVRPGQFVALTTREAQSRQMREWAKVHGLTRAMRPCIHRIIGIKCPRSILAKGAQSCWPPGTDHPVLWLRDGKAVRFESHVYHLGADTLRDMLDYANLHGIEFDLDGYSWYYPGRTLRVTWRKRAAYPEGV